MFHTAHIAPPTEQQQAELAIISLGRCVDAFRHLPSAALAHVEFLTGDGRSVGFIGATEIIRQELAELQAVVATFMSSLPDDANPPDLINHPPTTEVT